MKKVIITDEQFFTLVNKLFNALYNRLRYKYVRPKKDRTKLFVYQGNSLRKYSIGGGKPNYILIYFPDDESLWISDFVYTEMKKHFPRISDNLLFFDFFKKWFSDKFNIIPKDVYIINEGPLSDLYKNR